MKKATLYLAGLLWATVFSVSAQVKPILCQGHYYKEDEALVKLQEYAKTYSNVATWEKRATLIREGIIRGAKLDKVPAKAPLNPIRGKRKKMKGYTVENVAFESLPGFWATGNLYLPDPLPASIPGILVAHGHFNKPLEYGRFMPDNQKLCATLARAGAAVFTYDMVGWGESQPCGHEANDVVKLQTWNSMRSVDFLLSLGMVDDTRLAITGPSGGGTQAFLLSAIDPRIDVSAPMIQVSAHFFGGCNCESAMPIHKDEYHETNNVEIAAVFAPKPMLLVSDGKDWTKNTPKVEYPYIRNVYALYGAEKNVENVHLPQDGHDLGYSKRKPVYDFLIKQLRLRGENVRGQQGDYQENFISVQERKALEVFSEKPQPVGTLKDCSRVMAILNGE